MNKVGIGILLFNELANARKILEDIKKYQIDDMDFYFFDNGSCNEEFSNWLATIDSENIKVLSVDSNLGFGGGAKYLISHIPNDIRGYMPGNYKIRPESLIGLPDKIADIKDFEVFKAIRSGRSLSEKLKTTTLGLFTSAYFAANMLDSGGTPTLMSSRYAGTFLNGPDDYSFEAYVLLRCRKMKICVTRLPISYGTRMHGASYWQNGLKSELRLLSLILRQKKKWTCENSTWKLGK